MNLSKGTLAGFINAVVSLPDGLASAALAGVNPVYGLYASIAGPIAGSALDPPARLPGRAITVLDV